MALVYMEVAILFKVENFKSQVTFGQERIEFVGNICHQMELSSRKR